MKNFGNAQNVPPRITIKVPLSAKIARELYSISLSPIVKSDAARRDRLGSITILRASGGNIAVLSAGFRRRMVRLRRVSTAAIAQNLNDFYT